MFVFRFLFRLYNLYFSPEKDFAQRVRSLTGFVPARLSIFKLAFSHKSSQFNREPGQTNNERLEYLGDAVLGTVVAEYLFKKYPNADEGFLTKMRSKIVKRKSLNYIGDQMGLNVLLSEYNRTRLSSSMLGNAVEALVGAVYLEKGYKPTKRFIVQRILKLYVDVHELETVDDNFKSQLLEACQRDGKSIGYQLVSKYKQERRDRFQVAVVINGEQIATADDYNKKAAEQLASLKALQKLNLIEPGTLPTGTHLATTTAPPRRTDRKPAAKPRDSDDVASASRQDNVTKTDRRSDRHSKSQPTRATSAAETADGDESRSNQPARKLSFAEATAFVAAEGGSSATSKALSAPPKNKKSKRGKAKQRSASSYFVRHALRGAEAVALLMQAWDVEQGRFIVEARRSSEAPEAKPSHAQPSATASIETTSEKTDARASAQELQLTSRSKSGRSRSKRGLSRHLIRKMVKDAAAGVTASAKTSAPWVAADSWSQPSAVDAPPKDQRTVRPPEMQPLAVPAVQTPSVEQVLAQAEPQNGASASDINFAPTALPPRSTHDAIQDKGSLDPSARASDATSVNPAANAASIGSWEDTLLELSLPDVEASDTPLAHGRNHEPRD